METSLTASMHLKIGELARRAGVTPRTLHHYDRIGLLTPSGHSESGYRLYGPADVTRLYRILALRDVGLSLADIGALLDGTGSTEASLEALIERQLVGVRAKQERQERLAERLEGLLRQVRRRIEPGVDRWLDVLALMTLHAKYLSANEVADLHESATDWAPLVREAKRLLAAGGDPRSADAERLARAWLAALQTATDGRKETWRKVVDMYVHEPELQQRTGIDAEVLGFLTRAIAHLAERDAAAGDVTGSAVSKPAAPAMSEADFDGAYARGAPWDIGRPQPAFAALLERECIAGPALEVGCGTGDLALALAAAGTQPVLGIDLAASAIRSAQEKADWQRASADFEVHDALALAPLGRRFRAILDSGFLHTLPREVHPRFVRELSAVAETGARYYLLGLAVDLPLPNAPRALRLPEIAAAFQPYWTVEWDEATRFVTRWSADGVPSLLCCLRRTEVPLD